ncbi:MAG: YdiU family protein [Myxococcales bacterium]|nr:YdiU family protein [Myxococcales bacterium]
MGTAALASFDNSYARLPERFFARVAPARVAAPRLIRVNRSLAARLGMNADWLEAGAGASLFSGNEIPDGAEPIALAYAGHQFGSFVPQLGDGRAVLLGEVIGSDGERRDVQLKGAGRTPFSRGGDGRAAIGPVLREYIVSEAMAALGVRTTRALAAVTTGERVMRDEVLPGAILTRVAASHIRVGTFEFFAARSDRDALVALAAHAVARHYPDAVGSGNDALALLERVIDAQADLVASWLGVGFVHGVMNTDNTSISGETLDYGPCAFLDEFNPDKVFSSIDHGGRYAFSNQPRIAQWNLARLAESLLELLSDDEASAVRMATEQLERFPARFEEAYARVLRAKLGLERAEPDDLVLAQDLLARLASGEVDHTVFFRRLCASAADPVADADVVALFAEPAAFRSWAETWRARLSRESGDPTARAASMRLANPAFIPRNHQIQAVIDAAVGSADLRPFEQLIDVLARPYDDQPEHAHLAEPPLPEERVRQTFCGT